MSGGELDRASVERVGAGAGVAPAAIAALDDPAVSAAVAGEMAAARAPSPAALAVGHRLGGGGSRYSTPSYRYGAGAARFELVGIHPFEAHEAVLANLRPDLRRRPAPDSAADVLAWAGEPLATAEVAAVMTATTHEVRSALGDVADFRPAGLDGFWSLR
jgi:hypothetical protein